MVWYMRKIAQDSREEASKGTRREGVEGGRTKEWPSEAVRKAVMAYKQNAALVRCKKMWQVRGEQPQPRSFMGPQRFYGHDMYHGCNITP